MKIAFLDRDGTIISDYADSEWRGINEPVFLEGSVEGLKILSEKGFKFIIITNQYLIGEGIITLQKYNDFHNKVIDFLEKNDIKIINTYYCPHSRSDNCFCMKPKPGLINLALKDYKNIDLAKSILVGDSLCDILLAEKFNMPIYLVGNKDECNQSTYKKIFKIQSIKDIRGDIL